LAGRRKTGVATSDAAKKKIIEPPTSCIPLMALKHEPLRLGSCVTDRDSIYRILQELEEYCANTEDLQSLDEVFLRIDAIIEVVERRLDQLEHPSGAA
jgi:hypothetical protein